MYTLGINAALSDPSACLVKDGRIIVAAQEERLTGNISAHCFPFHACGLPFHAINHCLAEEGIVLSDVDHIAYSFNPYALLTKDHSRRVTVHLEEETRALTWPKESEWDPLFLSSVASAPRQLSMGAPPELRERMGNIASDGPFVWHFVDHHLAHAASAFFASPFKNAAVMVMDAGGEKAATTYSLGTSGGFTSLGEVSLEHSLVGMFKQLVRHLGFESPRDDLTVIALSTTGKPLYADDFRRMILPSGNGQYATQKTPLDELFGPRRAGNEPLTDRHADMASSFQVVLQESVLTLLQWLKKETGEETLCMAGDLALNFALNGFLRRHSPFPEIWIQPAAGDTGTSLGAALWVDSLERAHLDGTRAEAMERIDLGPAYPEADIASLLSLSRTGYRKPDDLYAETAELLTRGKTLGWFQGRMEFGTSGLGWRAILSSPLSVSSRVRINLIKERREFRPCAAAILAESAGEWLSDPRPSPFMQFSGKLLPSKTALLPACCCGDGTARVHTVDKSTNPAYHRLIAAFGRMTGVPALAVTSFNAPGKPVVCSPEDALRAFWTLPLDALAIGPFLVEKPK